MQRKICPICDRKLKAGNFCPVCRRWVKKPLYMDVDYYLNERHPEYEDKCEYHSVSAHGDKGEKRMPAGTSAKHGRAAGRLNDKSDRPNRTPDRLNRAADRLDHVPNRQDRPTGIPSRTSNAGQRKKKSSSGSFFVVIAAIIIINVVMGLSGSLKGLLEDLGKLAEAGGIKETSEKVEMIYDPVTGNERCNGFNHFPAVLEDLHPVVESWLNDHGYEITEIRTDISNQEMRSESHTTTYYASTESFMIRSDGDFDHYVEIAYDSVTEEIHALRSVLKTREEAESLWEAAGPILGISLNEEEIRKKEPDDDEWIWTEGEGYTTLLYPARKEEDGLYGVIQPY